MLQEVIVYIIGVITAICVIVWLYRIIVRRRNPCSGCGGCDVKDRSEAERRDCGSKPEGGCGG